MIKKEFAISTGPLDIRVALIEDGVVAEYYVERTYDRGIVGNIYRGKVARVLPGMEAAFIDIGLSKAAFLYVGDVEKSAENGNEDVEFDGSRGSPAIKDLLREGQEIMVQISKDAIGQKGARVTSRISLPGRYLVALPGDRRVGISRKIAIEADRDYLRDLSQKLKEDFECGFIIRTASAGKISYRQLKTEGTYLSGVWKEIQTRYASSRAPALLNEELRLSLRCVRDFFTEDIQRLVVDSKDEYDEIIRFIKMFRPSLLKNVTYYKGPTPLFDQYGVDAAINKALGRRIWLKSGGYILVDQTEALTAIDVNTGKYTGKRNLEETILRTNLEAVREIVAQLRLRNIGGIIVIDFIDMENSGNRDQVFTALETELKKDRTKTTISKISELGLVEMTRKRTSENLNQTLCEACPYCERTGTVKSKMTVFLEVFRQIEQAAARSSGKEVIVRVHPGVAEYLESDPHGLAALRKRLKPSIRLEAASLFHQEQFEIEII